MSNTNTWGRRSFSSPRMSGKPVRSSMVVENHTTVEVLYDGEAVMPRSRIAKKSLPLSTILRVLFPRQSGEIGELVCTGACYLNLYSSSV